MYQSFKYEPQTVIRTGEYSPVIDRKNKPVKRKPAKQKIPYKPDVEVRFGPVDSAAMMQPLQAEITRLTGLLESANRELQVLRSSSELAEKVLREKAENETLRTDNAMLRQRVTALQMQFGVHPDDVETITANHTRRSKSIKNSGDAQSIVENRRKNHLREQLRAALS